MTETTSAPTETTESVEEFAARARAWLAENMPRIDPANPPDADRGEEAPWLRARELQKKLYDGGFAGICFPREYGGLGLPIAYQKAFDDESPLLRDADHPEHADVHDLRRDHPRHRQRRAEAATHFGRAARRRGARAAAVRAQRRIRSGRRHHPRRPQGRQVGDQRREDLEHQRIRRRLRADAGPHRLGRAQARGPDDVPGADRQPGHHVAPHQAGQRLASSSARSSSTTSNSATTPSSARSTSGWHVASRQLYHERRAVGGGSEFASGIGAEGKTDVPIDYVALLEATGQADNERAREMAGRALVHRAVQEQLIDHVYHGVLDGSLPPAAGSIIRVTHAETHHLEFDTALALTGSCGRRRRRRRPDPLRRALPVAADGGARRRHHRDRTQHHRRTRARLPPRVRRRPRRAVQSGQAQQACAETVRTAWAAGPRRAAAAGASAARNDRRSGARPCLATSGVTLSCNMSL